MSAMSDIQTELELNWSQPAPYGAYFHVSGKWWIRRYNTRFQLFWDADGEVEHVMTTPHIENAVHYVSLVESQQV